MLQNSIDCYNRISSDSFGQLGHNLEFKAEKFSLYSHIQDHTYTGHTRAHHQVTVTYICHIHTLTLKSDKHTHARTHARTHTHTLNPFTP
uniref:Uncharacterized protein n=1 Tax=Arion vulgaris TaxID=1028688 RepID=A0A0B6ZG32_9EUPU